MSRRRRSTDKVEEAVEFFIKATEPIKSRGNLELKLSLDALEERSKTSGLCPEHIEALIDVAACGQHAESTSSKLIRCLIPSTVVPEAAVVKAISHMCTNKPSSNIQHLIIRWILLVYDYIDKKDRIHNLYGLIFYFIENHVLLPHVCNLLYLLTRKEDVKMFRVRQLLNLQTRIGSQPYLTGLLSIYKLYYPNLVSICLPKTKRLFFPMRDHQWSAIIKRVQEQNQPEVGLTDQSLSTSRLKAVETSQLRGAPVGKKRKLDPIPIIHSNASREVVDPRDDITKLLEHKRVPFVQIGEFNQLLQKIDQIEFPSQIGALLRSSMLQHLIAYSGDRVTACRLSYWLQATLADEILDHSTNKEDVQRNESLLDMLIRFMEFTQEGIPVVEQFLGRFLFTWNGIDYKPQIFRIITHCRLQQFDKLNDVILEPLRKLYFCSTVYFKKCQTVLCLTELLRNIASCEWPRYQEMFDNQNSQVEGQTKTNFTTLFTDEFDNIDPVSTLIDMIEYISKLCVLGLQIEQSHNLLQHCTLDFLDLVSTLREKYDVPCSMFPSYHIFVRPFFSNNAMGISRVCSIISNYKKSFALMKENTKNKPAKAEEDKSLRICNRVILDTSNGLWKGSAFTPVKEDCVYFNFDPTETDQSLSKEKDVFSLYMHQGILGYSLMFLKETQPEENRGHPKGIKGEKDVFLSFLEREQVYGIPDFIRTFIRRGQRKSFKENERP